MRYGAVWDLFCELVPSEDKSHMLCWFSNHAKVGILHLFTHGLFTALSEIDEASPGYAEEMLRRISKVEGLGTEKYQAIVQVLAEIYVSQGAVAAADITDSGLKMFGCEPNSKRGKNPEFESRSQGLWYAVEVKAPGLVVHAKERTKKSYQFLARLGKDLFTPELVTQPRDNPIKDFLVSADAKFKAYSKLRPEAYRILTIVWDDAVQEPLAALENTISGLLTPNSFHKDAEGQAVTYAFVDGIIVCRCQNQLYRALIDFELAYDDVMPFGYHNTRLPFKAFVQNPYGREVPANLFDALNASPMKDGIASEYQPLDGIAWIPNWRIWL